MTAQRAMRRTQWAMRYTRCALRVAPLTLLVAHCPLIQAATTFEQQAQAAWASRDKPGQTEAAIHLWEQATQAEPTRADLWIDLAKALGRAVRHADTSKKKKAWADEARSAADKALRLRSNDAQTYAIYGEALGQWANTHKGMYSLSAVRQAVNALHKAIAIDPQYAYAHMLLAEFYRQAPRMFSIGDKKIALEQAKLAVQYGPAYAINHLALANAYLDVGKKEEGIAELQKVMSITPPADAIPETHADKETAWTMMRSLGIVPQTSPCTDTAGACTEQP
jgi:tetratricopeptide (TPR) repeat protein